MSCQQVPRLPEDPYTFTEPPATAKYFSSQVNERWRRAGIAKHSGRQRIAHLPVRHCARRLNLCTVPRAVHYTCSTALRSTPLVLVVVSSAPFARARTARNIVRSPHERRRRRRRGIASCTSEPLCIVLCAVFCARKRFPFNTRVGMRALLQLLRGLRNDINTNPNHGGWLPSMRQSPLAPLVCVYCTFCAQRPRKPVRLTR